MEIKKCKVALKNHDLGKQLVAKLDLFMPKLDSMENQLIEAESGETQGDI